MLEKYNTDLEELNAQESRKFIQRIVSDPILRAQVKYDYRLPEHFQKLAKAVDNSLYRKKKSLFLEVLNNSLKNPRYAKELLDGSNDSLPSWFQETLKSLSIS